MTNTNNKIDDFTKKDNNFISQQIDDIDRYGVDEVCRWGKTECVSWREFKGWWKWN